MQDPKKRSIPLALGFAAALHLLAGKAAAQTTAVGNLLPSTPNSGTGQAAVTAVDLAAPATSSGNLTSATIRVGTRGCATSVTVKFFRPSGSTLIFLGQRGPFNITSDPQTVPLTPPFSIQAGDLIGLGSADTCAYIVFQSPGLAAGFLLYESDVSANVPVSPALFTDSTLPAYASGPAVEALAGIVAVVVSSPGIAPALFKTGVQIHNSTALAESGRLVFRRQGTSTSGGDASLSFSLAPGQVQSFDDLLPAMGLTGAQIGSLDVVSAAGSQGPVIAARIFNDGGAAGTSGFTVGLTSADAVLETGDRGVLFTPSDLARFRMNIGIRTGTAGASAIVTRRDSAGALVQTLSKVYPPNFFEQIAATAFLSGTAFGANDSITIQVTAGSITVYGATADNASQDPSLQFATKAP
jgi:hypothetical protein